MVAEVEAQLCHFWQALAFEDGSLVTEVVSNHYLGGNDRWSGSQEDDLAALGWERPDPPRSPNWIRVEFTTSPAVADVAALFCLPVGGLPSGGLALLQAGRALVRSFRRHILPLLLYIHGVPHR